jgi:hypothetical protein
MNENGFGKLWSFCFLLTLFSFQLQQYMTEERKPPPQEEKKRIPFRWMPRHNRPNFTAPADADKRKNLDTFMLYLLNREPPISAAQWKGVYKGRPDPALWLEFNGIKGATLHRPLNPAMYYAQATPGRAFSPLLDDIRFSMDTLKLTSEDLKTMRALQKNNIEKEAVRTAIVEKAEAGLLRNRSEWQAALDRLVTLTEQEHKLLDTLPAGQHRLASRSPAVDKFLQEISRDDPARSAKTRTAFLQALREQANQFRAYSRNPTPGFLTRPDSSFPEYAEHGVNSVDETVAATGTPFQALTGAAARAYSRYIYAPTGSDERKHLKQAFNAFLDRRKTVKVRNSKPPLPFTQTTQGFAAIDDQDAGIHYLTPADYGLFDQRVANELAEDRQRALAAFDDDGHELGSQAGAAGAAIGYAYSGLDDVD